MNAKAEKIIQKLNDKKYRDAFVGSQIQVGIPFQVRALRAKRNWDQKTLAEKSGMAQPRISAIESPGDSRLNLRTLQRIASALDVGLIVRFAPFSELVRFSDAFSPDDFDVASFADDMATYEPTALNSVSNTLNNVFDIHTRQRVVLDDMRDGTVVVADLHSEGEEFVETKFDEVECA